MGNDLTTTLKTCEADESLLARAIRMREKLDEVIQSLQERHLHSCLFPQVDVVAPLAEALQELSARRFGALIAFERTVRLADYAASGTLLDAALSSRLLLSLFFPGNALHDGAVIIRDNRIAAAACVLPLSQNHAPFRRRSWGTRHRAAVGLSQVSDAVVWMVSEQSGKISMALGGELFHDPPFARRAGQNANPVRVP